MALPLFNMLPQCPQQQHSPCRQHHLSTPLCLAIEASSALQAVMAIALCSVLHKLPMHFFTRPHVRPFRRQAHTCVLNVKVLNHMKKSFRQHLAPAWFVGRCLHSDVSTSKEKTAKNWTLHDGSWSVELSAKPRSSWRPRLPETASCINTQFPIVTNSASLSFF